MKKKVIIFMISILGLFSIFANTNINEEFTFSEYEKLCLKNGKEPSYEEWKNLTENPQCYYEEDNFEKITDEDLLSILLEKEEN